MHPFHISISVINLLCGLAVALAYTTNFHREDLLGFGIFVGYFANLLAVVISIVLFVILIVRYIKGQGKPFIARNWLGIFNGVFVLLFWPVAFCLSRYFDVAY